MKLPDSVNILLLGSGGREHAIAWKLSKSPRLSRLYIAPGNAGTSAVGTNVDLQPTNFGSVKHFILSNNINLIVVGPEEPLVKGLTDFIHGDADIHVPVIGPVMAGARLEGSKDFAKSFMLKYGIPTARYKSFSKGRFEDASTYLESMRPPYVLKADGLAAGKGVVIPTSLEEARSELQQFMDGKFGNAGSTVVIEEFLDGIECSVFVATDGKDYKILPVAKDYKRIGAGDTGLNTGGMGAISPVPFADDEFMDKVEKSIIIPTIEGLKSEGIDYKGFIFIGLMNVGGDPYVIEYNVRLGDPETETIMPLIDSDLIELFEAMAFGKLKSHELVLSGKSSATVVCVSGGYPGDYTKGHPITGLDNAGNCTIFHAGTGGRAGKVTTAGGRVLAVTGTGETLEQCLSECYSTVKNIDYDGKYYREDIGQDVLAP